MAQFDIQETRKDELIHLYQDLELLYSKGNKEKIEAGIWLAERMRKRLIDLGYEKLPDEPKFSE
ncbi:MAG: hypothetical protein LBN42_00940 [Oscillospiraceae bacterium]|jgi:hypothetical protein|nr:hypothetical protein [Oscillospiraceae bacterium]